MAQPHLVALRDACRASTVMITVSSVSDGVPPVKRRTSGERSPSATAATTMQTKNAQETDCSAASDPSAASRAATLPCTLAANQVRFMIRK